MSGKNNRSGESRRKIQRKTTGKGAPPGGGQLPENQSKEPPAGQYSGQGAPPLQKK